MLASKFSYENTQTQIKNGQLSRNFTETLGVKQGHRKSSDNYKIYINSLLDAVGSDQSMLVRVHVQMTSI